MNRFAGFATFVAAIGATLGLASTAALAAKPAPPAPPNPCLGAQANGFPAMVFTRQRTTGGHVYYDTILADKTGQCQQTIFTADGFAPSYPASDVNLRYGATSPTTGGGVIVRGGGAPGLTIIASQYSVSFDTSGVPTVPVLPSGDYSNILALADLTHPPELPGWSKYVMANPLISPDGTKMLVTVAFRQIQGTVETVWNTFWTCPLDWSQQSPVAATSCQMVYLGAPGGLSPGAGWGGLSDSIYITATSPSSGSSSALFHLSLTTQALSQMWNRGTYLSAPKGRFDAVANRELVAVWEWGGSNGCNRILVIDAGTCGTNNACDIQNGSGTPARSLTWLPNGRLAGEGQTAPNRKGQCSASGSIVTFDPYDPNGIPTTVLPAGSFPDGAGGG